jgi:hypothetical protein
MSENEAQHNDDTLQQAAQHASTNQEDDRDVSSSLSPGQQLSLLSV